MSLEVVSGGLPMGWFIKCMDSQCRQQSAVPNIVELINRRRDEQGWFLCSCGKRGYIEKTFAMQEGGDPWKPFLRGIIPLGTDGDWYQPFVFLVSYDPNGEVTSVWFSYYKDLRSKGGRLKLGYGPGGPPVLGKSALLNLLSKLRQAKYLTSEEVTRAVCESQLEREYR
jgi:hypothetical protein